jgi:hypothetical protein
MRNLRNKCFWDSFLSEFQVTIPFVENHSSTRLNAEWSWATKWGDLKFQNPAWTTSAIYFESILIYQFTRDKSLGWIALLYPRPLVSIFDNFFIQEPRSGQPSADPLQTLGPPIERILLSSYHLWFTTQPGNLKRVLTTMFCNENWGAYLTDLYILEISLCVQNPVTPFLDLRLRNLIL